MSDASGDAPAAYPWYGVVRNETLEQGDFFFALPAYVPEYPQELVGVLNRLKEGEEPEESISVETDISLYDVIVLTQSCDLLYPKKTPLSVLVCPVFALEDAKIHQSTLDDIKVLNEARQGKMPGIHMLAACEVPEFPLGIQIAFFHQIFTIPISYIRSVAAVTQPRLRLLPPYKEHLAQAFARFVMRVGLPQDIPNL